jgi:hypothetical protein
VINIIPYSFVDEKWSLSDSAIFDAYQRTLQQGSIKTVFWDGKIKSKEDFLNYFQAKRNLPIFVFKDHAPCGYAWINNIGCNHAYAHFCYFKQFWGDDKSDIFETVINYWFSFTNQDSFLFDTLIGMVPKFNKFAIKHIQENGFTKVGEIPNMVNDIYRKTKSSIVIFYRCRK